MPTDGAAGPDVPRVFVTFSAADADGGKRLLTHLQPWARDGLLTVSSAADVKVSADRKTTLRSLIASSDAAIVLVSANLMADEPARSNELLPIVDQHQERNLTALVVFARFCALDALLAPLPRVNTSETAMSALSEHELDKMCVAVTDWLARTWSDDQSPRRRRAGIALARRLRRKEALERGWIRGAPLLVAAVGLLHGIFGPPVLGEPARVAAVEITDRTQIDAPRSEPWTRFPLPLSPVAELLDKIVAERPRCIALAIDLREYPEPSPGAPGRTADEITRLAKSIRAARDLGVDVVVPNDASPTLAAAVRPTGQGTTRVLQNSIFWGQSVRGVALDQTMPISLALVSAEVPWIGSAALLPSAALKPNDTPSNADSGVLQVPAAVVLEGHAPTLGSYVVIAGSLHRQGAEDTAADFVIASTPWSSETVSSAYVHALLAGYALNGALIWQVSSVPVLLLALGGTALFLRGRGGWAQLLWIATAFSSVALSFCGFFVPSWAIVALGLLDFGLLQWEKSWLARKPS